MNIFMQDITSCDGHRDSVLGLAWNKAVRNILASASADRSVKVWDMAWPKCVLTISHPDKVNLPSCTYMFIIIMVLHSRKFSQNWTP